MLANWFFLLLALVAGALMPTQAAVNNKLATYVHSPVLSAFISFLVGTVALLVYILAAGIPLNNMASTKNAPWITWTGGLCGAFFVTAVVVLVPRLGVALTFSLLIAGQMLASLPIDHYGFLGTAVREINLPRILGVLFVIIGVVLIRKY
jgi:bacterial/archaeal transporter family-2 protein